MRAIIQRVSSCDLHIDGILHASILQGLLVLLGITHDDDLSDIDYLIRKILQMRVFADREGKMNDSVLDCNGHIMVVSQFTLFASTKKGNRPGFTAAAKPDLAIPLYNTFMQRIQEISNLTITSGVFGADMKITLINDGPVTIFIDSKHPE